MFKHTNNAVHEFESPAEFGNFCKLNKVYYGSNNLSWFGHITGEEAATLAIKGDDSQVEAAQKLADEFEFHIERDSFMDMPSVAGCYPCVPEALAGEPECMREPVVIESSFARLEIIVDTVCSGGFSAKQMQQRGVAILAAVMAISAVRPVTFKLAMAVDAPKNSKGDEIAIVVINIPSAPLDLASSAYVLTHIGFTRRLAYAYAKQYMNSDVGWPVFKGHEKYTTVATKVYEEKVREYLSISDDVLYVPPVFISDKLIENPKEWVKDKIEQYTS